MDYGLGLINPFADGKSYRISSPAGPRAAPLRGASTYHQGTDYAAPMGTQLIAPMSGVITVVGFEPGYGNRIGICDGGKCVHLAHLDKLANQFKPNQRIEAGTPIGSVGSTGRSTGPHLDYTVTLNGKVVNHEGKVLDRMAKQSYLRGMGAPTVTTTARPAPTTMPLAQIPVAPPADLYADIEREAEAAAKLANALSPQYTPVVIPLSHL